MLTYMKTIFFLKEIYENIVDVAKINTMNILGNFSYSNIFEGLRMLEDST